MLTQPLIQQLHDLRLRGMARALETQHQQPDLAHLSFDDRLGLLVQQETAERQSQRLFQRLRWARLPVAAALEDVDTRTPRGIERGTWSQVCAMTWVADRLNVLIVGATGMGKSYLASALAHQACRQDLSVRYFRVPRLAEELAPHHAVRLVHARARPVRQLHHAVIDLGLDIRRVLDHGTGQRRSRRLASVQTLRGITGMGRQSRLSHSLLRRERALRDRLRR